MFRFEATQTLKEHRNVLSTLELAVVVLRLGLDVGGDADPDVDAQGTRSSSPLTTRSSGAGGTFQRLPEEVASILCDGGRERLRWGVPAHSNASSEVLICPTKKLTPAAVQGIFKTALGKIPLSPDPGFCLSDFLTRILLETPHLLFVNKRAGQRVTPIHRLVKSSSALGEALAYTCSVVDGLHNDRGPQHDVEPTPLHRLDVWTSGVLVFAKSISARKTYSKASYWADKTRKRYLAVVKGRYAMDELPEGKNSVQNKLAWYNGELEELGTGVSSSPPTRKSSLAVAIPLGGKSAQTDITLLKKSSCGVYGLLLCELVRSGRNHQIRRHCAKIGCPVVGDVLYGGRVVEEGLGGRFLLHAWEMEMREESSCSSSCSIVESGIQHTVRASLSELMSAKLQQWGLEFSQDEAEAWLAASAVGVCRTPGGEGAVGVCRALGGENGGMEKAEVLSATPMAGA